MDRILIIDILKKGSGASSAPILGLCSIIFKHVYYTPGIYADGYIVFAFPFVRSFVRSFVR